MLLPFLNENETEAGCDEAGRGCLAGSVFAAAVILPKNFNHPLLIDGIDAENCFSWSQEWPLFDAKYEGYIKEIIEKLLKEKIE